LAVAAVTGHIRFLEIIDGMILSRSNKEPKRPNALAAANAAAPMPPGNQYQPPPLEYFHRLLSSPVFESTNLRADDNHNSVE